MRPFIVGVDPETLWLTLPPVAPSSAPSAIIPSSDWDSFDGGSYDDLRRRFEGKPLDHDHDDRDYFPSSDPAGPPRKAAPTLLDSYRSSPFDRLPFEPLPPVLEVEESPFDSSDDDDDEFDTSSLSSCEPDRTIDDDMASSLAFGQAAAGTGVGASVDMDTPFGIGGSPTGPAASLQQLYPGSVAPSFDLSAWLDSPIPDVDRAHSPVPPPSASPSASSSITIPSLLPSAQFQPAPAPLQARHQPQPYRPPIDPRAFAALQQQAQPPAPRDPATSSPLVDLLRDQASREARSTSLPPPSQPKPLRRRTQDSADIPSIAAYYYPSLFPQSPKGDGMATLAPTPPASGRVEAKSPKLKQRTTADAQGNVDEPPSKAGSNRREAVYRLGNLGLEGLNGQKRPHLPSLYSSYAPLPTPSSGSDSNSGTPSPLPTPYPTASDNVSGPSTDHPLSEAERGDIWDRLKRDFAGIDPAVLRGPFRQLALRSLKENGVLAATQASQISPASMVKRPAQTTTAAGQAQHLQTPRANPSRAGPARTTVSPKEAFVDYDDVSHRLSGRVSSPRPPLGGLGLFGAALMERNPSSPITFTGSPASSGTKAARLAAAPPMDRRTSMPEVWSRHHHHPSTGSAAGPPTPGGTVGGQHGFERRGSPSSGLRLPPHQLPKNAMRISDGHHPLSGTSGAQDLAGLAAGQEPVLLDTMVDDYSPSSEEDPSPPVPEPLGASLFGPISDVKTLTPGGHVVVRSAEGSYFPQGITGADDDDAESQPYVTAAVPSSLSVGGKSLPGSKGRSQSHPPHGGTRTSGRTRAVRRRSSTSSPEASVDGDDGTGDVPMAKTKSASSRGGTTTATTARHSDAGGRRHVPATPHRHDDDEEEEEYDEEDEQEEDEDELEDDEGDEDYAELGGGSAGRVKAAHARSKPTTSSGGGRSGAGRKRKQTAAAAAAAGLDSLSDTSSTGPPSKKRQRHDDSGAGSASSPRGWGTHVSAEQRKVHGRSGHGSIRCDFVYPDSGERCDVVFRRPYDLARHKETIHEAKGKKKQQWVCEECKGSFSRKDALMRYVCVSCSRFGLGRLTLGSIVGTAGSATTTAASDRRLPPSTRPQRSLTVTITSPFRPRFTVISVPSADPRPRSRSRPLSVCALFEPPAAGWPRFVHDRVKHERDANARAMRWQRRDCTVYGR